MERMVAIAERNSAQGARQGDPEHGVGNQSNNRKARALNDVGWEVHAGNYEANLYQVGIVLKSLQSSNKSPSRKSLKGGT